MRTAYLFVSMKFDLFHDLFFQGSAWIAKSVVFSTQFWCLHKTRTCQNTCQHAANCTIMTETPNWKTINHLNISHASIWDLLKWTLRCHPQKLKHLLINLFFFGWTILSLYLGNGWKSTTIQQTSHEQKRVCLLFQLVVFPFLLPWRNQDLEQHGPAQPSARWVITQASWRP